MCIARALGVSVRHADDQGAFLVAGHGRAVYPGSVCWIEVSSTDPGGGRDFYAGLMGWTYQIDRGRGHDATALCAGWLVAGLAGVAVAAGHVAWTVYLTSASITHTAAVFTQWGGQVLHGPVDVSEHGRVSSGRIRPGVCSVWQPATPWTFRTTTPGSLFWAELNTWHGALADKIFTTLFGYRQKQIGDGVDLDYTTWSRGGQMMLGRL